MVAYKRRSYGRKKIRTVKRYTNMNNIMRNRKRKNFRRSLGPRYKRKTYLALGKRRGAKSLSGRAPRAKFGRQRKDTSKVSLAVASSVLGSYVQKECTAFYNGKMIVPSALATYLDELNRRSLSHLKQINKLCPIKLFSQTNLDLGIDDNITNPNCEVQKTTIRFTDNSSTSAHIFSCYEPLTCSVTSLLGLNQLLGLNVEDASNLCALIFSKVLCALYAVTAEGVTQVQIFTIAQIIADREAVRDPVRIFLQTRIQAVFRQFLYDVYVKKVGRFFIESYLAINVSVPNAYTYQFNYFVPVSFEGVNRDAFNRTLKTTFTQWANTIPGRLGEPRVNIMSPIEVPLPVDHLYLLSCLATADTETQIHFCGFIADVFAVCARNADQIMNRLDSCFAHYVKELMTHRANRIDMAKHYDWLVSKGIIGLRQLDTKVGVKYTPKSVPNMHFLILQEGAHCKMSTYFKRDYTGFMSLFRNITKSKELQSKLNVDGIEFYRRLEPTYNLQPIPLDVQILNPDIVY